ncbi:MAG: zinc-dependent alcohol dehydrogenase [Candidatus Jordarchaeum sp.]|uniref:zinc-dependent alcohol dehydrogenase n=1 Tax=Candidatus Jordarchaeum sp. TaxID=2823881 RepID=UPI0040491FD6
MKALLWDGRPFPEGFSIKDIEKPIPKREWISVKTKLCGICGSDIGVINGRLPLLADFLVKPTIFGHEAVGVIEEISDGVTGFKVGDRVVCEGLGGCVELGEEPCKMCRLGRYNLCLNIAKAGSGVGASQANGGGFAEYFLAHKSKVYKVPDNITDEEAVLTEPLSVAVHSCFIGNPQGKSVAIIGAGAIGLQLLQVCRVMGGEPIFVISKYEFQAKLAEELGAHKVYCLERNQIPVLEIALETGEGVDQCYEAVGSEQTLQDAIALTRRGGEIIFVGVMGKANIDFIMFSAKELKLYGTWYYAFEHQTNKSSFEIALKLLGEGKIKNKPLLTKTYKLEQWKKAFEAQMNKKKHETTKIAIRYD